MKTLLYIDPFSDYGHVNLNKVYVRTLMDRGFDVRLVVCRGYVRDLGLPEAMMELEIPESLHKHGIGRWHARWILWRIFRHIASRLDLSGYDVVFFSAYEEISLFFSGIRRPVHLVNHANVAGLDNPVKRFFSKRLSRYAVHVVFARFIKDRLAHHGIDRAIIEPLGLTEPYRVDPARREPLLRSIHAKLASGEYENIIFSPSGSKYGSPMVGRIIMDPAFLGYLERTRTLLVVKDKSLQAGHPNVLILRDLLSLDQYQALFMESDLILICYPPSFNYRVSASLFESFSNRKSCLLTDIEGFRFFADHFNYDPYFTDTASLIKVIEAWRKDKASLAADPFRGLGAQVPTFGSLASAPQSLAEA